MRTSEFTVTSPVVISEPPTLVVVATETLAVRKAMLAATPRAPLKPRPSTPALAITSLVTVAVPMVPLPPLKALVTLPPLVTTPPTRPTPAPRPAEIDCASTWASPKERLRTVRVPAVTMVPDPTEETSTGELVAVDRPPATPAARAIAPSESRAKAGATTVGVPSPRIVL